jgi:hypothetical protein
VCGFDEYPKANPISTLKNLGTPKAQSKLVQIIRALLSNNTLLSKKTTIHSARRKNTFLTFFLFASLPVMLTVSTLLLLSYATFDAFFKPLTNVPASGYPNGIRFISVLCWRV